MADVIAPLLDTLPVPRRPEDRARVRQLAGLLVPGEPVRAVTTGRSGDQGEVLLAVTDRRVVGLTDDERVLTIPLSEVAYVATSGDSRAGGAVAVHGPTGTLRVADMPFRLAQEFAAAVRAGVLAVA
ncbi:hypothetical protein [Streptoalloteichus hindustanus]|uniref:PH domain-containing protein n=1 Tax=Streptoalloteichus hindustanus TaxID=2017 RepID=A0A1M4VYA6_STRHI|nr:hypothetical protein [Streptoalloteichus hindustanus]SHE73692.1 hypothetical protein SAMN05444320_101927 [Streptoalloteichus hindustanus]